MKLIMKLILIVAFLFTGTAYAQSGQKGAGNSKPYFGTASFYADKFTGRKTANGENYHPGKFTAACNVLPLGTYIRITNLLNNKSIIVRITDRLHPKMNRLVDISKIGAQQLGYIKRGLAKVKVEVLGKDKDVDEEVVTM